VIYIGEETIDQEHGGGCTWGGFPTKCDDVLSLKDDARE
jgi:hypothetical protein